MQNSEHINHPPLLCLASASAQRYALLRQLGLSFRVMAMDIDETRREGENASDYVLRLALAKARAARAALEIDLPVLGADTTVVTGEHILEKPADRQQATQMLELLSGASHRVCTGAGIVGLNDEKSVVVETIVTFRHLSAAEIQGYIETGEPFGKAGGYAIQGRAAAFIETISGSYSNVMGLPLFETAALLAATGIDVLNLPG